MHDHGAGQNVAGGHDFDGSLVGFSLLSLGLLELQSLSAQAGSFGKSKVSRGRNRHGHRGHVFSSARFR